MMSGDTLVKIVPSIWKCEDVNNEKIRSLVRRRVVLTRSMSGHRSPGVMDLRASVAKICTFRSERGFRLLAGVTRRSMRRRIAFLLVINFKGSFRYANGRY